MSDRHSIVYSTNLWGCKCFSFISDKDLDNGMLVTKGELETGEREIYKAEFDVSKPAYLVANPAWVYDDYNYERQKDESVYVNEACKPFRAYELAETRRYSVSSDITADELAAGDYVIMGSDGRITKAAGESNPSNAFVGKVIFVDNRGFTYAVGSAGNVKTGGKFYTVEVIKNKAV